MLGIAVDHNGEPAQHPRQQGRDRRHRRLDRQRQFPPHVRSAPDRGILRPCRHAVVRPGCQRRARRHGDRRVAVGSCSITPANSAPTSPSRARSAANTFMSICAGCPGSACSTRRARSGLPVADWQDVILVNMLGNRFYDETGGQFNYNNYRARQSLRARQLSQRQERRNTTRAIASMRRWPASAMASNGGGPIWAIFDADGGRARKMESASAGCRHRCRLFLQRRQRRRPRGEDRDEISARADAAANLEATVARYNSFVDAGKDEDFGKPKPLYKIAQAAVLRRLGDAGCPRYPRRPAHQRAMPGAST